MSYAFQYGDYRNRPLAFLRDHGPDYIDATDLQRRWPKAFGIVKNTAYSQSQSFGGPADQANYEYWTETYADTRSMNWWDLGHQSGILARIDLLTAPQKETYEYLEDNLVISDTRMAEIEFDLQQEQWDRFGREDFKKAILGGALDVSNEDEAIQNFLDELPDEAFDEAIFRAWYRTDTSPEVNGWEVLFKKPYYTLYPRRVFGIPLAQQDYAKWDGTVHGLIYWMAEEFPPMMTVSLSNKAFCRVSPEDARTKNYPGALFKKYGEEWALVISKRDIPKPAWPLIDMHLDENANFPGGQGASIEIPYDDNECENPYLVCAIKFVDDAKRRVIGGPAATWPEDHAPSEEDWADQQRIDQISLHVQNLIIEGALRCNVDPSSDLVEAALEKVLWYNRDRIDALSQERLQQFLMDQACTTVQAILADLPPVCTFPLPKQRRETRRTHGTPKRKKSVIA